MKRVATFKKNPFITFNNSDLASILRLGGGGGVTKEYGKGFHPSLSVMLGTASNNI